MLRRLMRVIVFFVCFFLVIASVLSYIGGLDCSAHSLQSELIGSALLNFLMTLYGVGYFSVIILWHLLGVVYNLFTGDFSNGALIIDPSTAQIIVDSARIIASQFIALPYRFCKFIEHWLLYVGYWVYTLTHLYSDSPCYPGTVLVLLVTAATAYYLFKK